MYQGFKGKYALSVITTASQEVNLIHEIKEIGYGDIEEIHENLSLEIYETETYTHVASIEWRGDDEDMYIEALEAIMEFEGYKKGEDE